MCNLYNITTSRQAVLEFTRAVRDQAGFNEPSLDVYPNRFAPIVRVGKDGEREVVRARWGMPSPQFVLKGKSHDAGVTNVRKTDSPHWRRWLAPQNRCLVPSTRFAEPDPASKREGGRTPNAWFALDESCPIFVFAGLWTPWSGKRMAREEPADHEVYGFLTTEPNGVVKPVHQKAMPVILTTAEEMDLWMTAPWAEARALQRPLPDVMLVKLQEPDGAKPQSTFIGNG